VSNERLRFLRAHVRAMRAIGAASRPRRRLPRQVYPRAIEREYARAIVRYVDRAREAFTPLLAELPALLVSVSNGQRRDAGEGKRARDLVDRARSVLGSAVTPRDIEVLAEEFARRTATHQRVQLNRQVKAALGADVFIADRGLQDAVDGFVSENVSLITDITRDLASKIEQAVTRAVTSATPHPKLAKELEERFGFAEKRARLIARDQVGKFYGAVNAKRQQDLGADRYVWRTVNDQRVRLEHRARDGQVFKWSDPPDDGHPGQPILCRCYAEPDFTSVLGDDE
jgi:SPP1 gp7 family putative phage head morphogenesis protein